MSAPNDLPEHARERLAEMRERKLFTSDLSVSELLLLREAGFEPLGLVMGTSIYQVAATIPSLSSGEPGRELVDTTKALYHARELAMNRMEEEADLLGADGVIGVRLTINLALDPNRQQWQRYRAWNAWAKKQGFRRPINRNVPTAGWFAGWTTLAQQQWQQWCGYMGWAQVPLAPWAQPQGPASYAFGSNTAEFMAVGTAVRHRGGGAQFRNRAGKPFQSDLSGQDFWMLVRCGYRPVGFVMGNCVYYVPPELLKAPPRQGLELSAYTHALYDARELAMERLQDEAEALGATGIVGVTIAERQHSWRTLPWNMGNAALATGEVIELFVIGTAVVAGEAAELGDPVLTLSMNDPVAPSAGEGGE
ncbi:MAG TPA: heavy metal-binding domain-containing protein [Kofleriaceae bacterium]|nr:heavy metal-binding domain-containing protein [Kofleriaceae bacterium]